MVACHTTVLAKKLKIYGSSPMNDKKDVIFVFISASMGVQAVPWNQMPTTNYITMQIVPAISTNEEAYECHVTGDSVNITGSSAAGVFYGVQTLITLREHPEGIPQVGPTCIQ